MNRRFRAFAAALIASAVLLLPLLAPVASAHASLVKASPANNEQLRRSPARVDLNFSEAITRKLTQIQVTDANNKRVDTNDIAFDDSDPTFASVGLKTLTPGVYYVQWHNVSAVDGHNLSGQYPFILLNPDGTFPAGVVVKAGSTSGGSLLPNNLDVALKWVALLSIATVAGAAFFLLVVLRPAAAFLDDANYDVAVDTGERWVALFGFVLLPAAFVASAGLILLTVSRFATGVSIYSYLTTVSVGRYRLLELMLILVALAGTAMLRRRSFRGRTVGMWVVIAATLGALFTHSLTSHAANGNGRFWAITSDAVHLASSAAWLGALMMILVVLRWRRAQIEEAPRFLFLASAFERFSVVAGLSVIAVFASGTFNSLVALPHWSALFHTTYGRVLLAKIALIVPLLAVAGLNAFILKPRLVTAIDGLYEEAPRGAQGSREVWQRQLARLRRLLPYTVAAEIVLVLAVFAAVGVLTQAETAKGEVAARAAQGASGAGKFEQVAVQNDLKLTLTITPNAVGLNTYDLIIQNAADGSPSTTVTQARLRFNYQDIPNAVAQSEIILSKFGNGEYKSAGAYFTEPGNWRADATIRRTDHDDVTRSFILPVARGQASSVAKKSRPFAMPFTTFGWSQVVGALIALTGGVVLVYRRELAGGFARSRRVVVTAGTAIFLGGCVLAFTVHSGTAASNLTVGNPVKPSQASTNAGKALFAKDCVVCHGITGKGDGPAAAQLNPAPSDFRLHMPLHTDPQFFNFIANGYPGSAMPTFRKQFSDTDIWNLVNYLRAAFTQ